MTARITIEHTVGQLNRQTERFAEDLRLQLAQRSVGRGIAKQWIGTIANVQQRQLASGLLARGTSLLARAASCVDLLRPQRLTEPLHSRPQRQVAGFITSGNRRGVTAAQPPGDASQDLLT